MPNIEENIHNKNTRKGTCQTYKKSKNKPFYMNVKYTTPQKSITRIIHKFIESPLFQETLIFFTKQKPISKFFSKGKQNKQNVKMVD